MTTRGQMREAKRAAGICVEPTCGSKALYPWEHCPKHVRTPVAKWAAQQPDVKNQANNRAT